MSIQEYKNKVVKDIEKLFKGIHFENVGIDNKKIIGMLTPEASEFFNNPTIYRKRTEELLTQISEYKTELLGTTLEFLSPNEEIAKQEVEEAIKRFIDKIRLEIDLYKHDIIKIAFQAEQDKMDTSIKIEELPEVREKNTINMGLNFIKIKVADKEYTRVKTGREAESEDVTIENLNLMILYVYILKSYIEDKNKKQEEFIDFVATNFSVTDKEYIEVRKLQAAFLNEKNYERFIRKYNLVIEEVVSKVINRNQEAEIEATKTK